MNKSKKNDNTDSKKNEPAQKRVLFPREQEYKKQYKANIMIALNEAPKKIEEPAGTGFSRVHYLPSGSILAFLKDKADATALILT